MNVQYSLISPSSKWFILGPMGMKARQRLVLMAFKERDYHWIACSVPQSNFPFDFNTHLLKR